MKEIKDIKDILSNLLSEKQQKNASYSLRALARDMKISQSHLSRILNGEIRPTPLIAYKIGQYLELSSDQTLHLISQTIH